MYDNFYAYIDILYLGGPEFCHGAYPRDFTFDDNDSPRINITLCGVSAPVVQGEFIGQKLNVQNTKINSYTHNYTLELPRLTKKTCGKELTVKTTGCNGLLTEKTKSFVKKCKYDYFVHLILLLSQF